MAASGYTPISLYYSTTASAVPTAGNLANGELALNIADMKLYAKNSSGTVTLLASNASTTGVDSLSFGSTGLTPSTATTGAITVAGTLNVANGGTGLTSLTAGYIPYGNGTSALASSSSLFFDGTNLGIGTSLPSEKLTVAGSVSSSSEFVIKSGTTAKFALGQTSDAFYIYSNAAGAERLRLDSAGNLGLGVTPSASSLTTFQCGVYGMVSGTEQANISGNAYYNAGWKYATTGTAVRMSVNEGTGQFRVFTAASGTAGNAITFTQAMTLDASGNLGVGTTSPSARVHVSGTTDATQRIIVNGSGNVSSYKLNYNGSEVAFIQNYQNSEFAIGTAVSAWMGFNTNNTERARISAAGGFSVGTTADPGAGAIYATGNITAYYSSDIKFKENVRDIPDALATVNAIGGKLFDWTDEYIESKGGADGYFVQKADFGVVAQDVQKVFPIAVRTRPDGSLAVDYEKLGALAFAALVELTKRVEALEAK